MPTPTRDPGLLSFTAKIEQFDNSGSSAFIEFPYDLKEMFGIGNLVPVTVTFDGIPCRGSIAKMGGPPMLLIRNDIRKQLGKENGDSVAVTVQVEMQPRKIETPADLEYVLKEASQWEYFQGLAYTHRKEYIRWIEEAKRHETRERRLRECISMLEAKQTR